MITGRKPKLTPRERDRLLFLYTVGTPRKVLAKTYGIDYSTVCAYIKGEHKNPSLRTS